MNSFLHALSALLAGAFLNLGLERLAERFDSVHRSSGAILDSELSAAMPCDGGGPCFVPAEYSLAQ